MTALSARDLAALTQTQQVVLSPLAHPSPEAWMRAVVGSLQDLFRADRAVGSLGGPAGSVLVASGVEDGALDAYAADCAADDLAGEVVMTHAVPYYVEEDFADDARFAAHTASAVYNEWYRAHGLVGSVGMVATGPAPYVPSLYAHHGVPLVANVLLSGTAASAGPGAARGRTLLALLQPALAASVDAWHRAGLASAQLAAAVDAVGAAWLYDESGRLLHASADAGARGAAVRAAAGRLAASLLDRRSARPLAPTRTVERGDERVSLTATYLQPAGRHEPAVLVAARPLSRPPADALRERTGLTPQQARVAALLAARRTTAEIAEALCISPHTVRRHTEQVLDRLGVSRREEVEAAVRRLAG